MTDRTSHSESAWLTKAEAAQVLRVSPRTLERYVAAGKVAVARTPGGHLRFLQTDVDALLRRAS